MKKCDRDLEMAYKKGYSHGFQTGIETPSEKMDELSEKIRVWKNEDEDDY